MMEGDLLEVALDETQHIWRILSHTNSPSSVRKYAAFEEVQANLNCDMKDAKKRGRKRKSEEFELSKKLGRQKVVDDKNLVKRKGFVNKDKKIVTAAAAPGPLKRGPRKVPFCFLFSAKKDEIDTIVIVIFELTGLRLGTLTSAISV